MSIFLQYRPGKAGAGQDLRLPCGGNCEMPLGKLQRPDFWSDFLLMVCPLVKVCQKMGFWTIKLHIPRFLEKEPES